MNPSDEYNTDRAYQYKPPTQLGKIVFVPPGTNRRCETAYWLWGDLSSETPPLIILHGGPGAPGRDLQVLAALQDRHGIPILLYDQIGCGESTHLRDLRGDTTFWTMDLFLAELDNIRKHFQIATFDLLGHSCGAMIAVSYALRQPQGLRKLIVASSSPCEALRVKGQMNRLEELPQDMQDVMTANEEEGRPHPPAYKSAWSEYMQRYFCRLDPSPPEIKETMALMEEDDTVQYTLYGPFSLKPTGPWKDYDVVSRLPEISEKTAPGGVLLTNGRYDMSSDQGMTSFLTQICARVKWVRFAESAHMAHIEQPQAFLATVGDFLTTS